MARELTMPGAALPAPPRRALTPTRGWPKPARKSMPFSGLMIFTFVLFVAPQNLIPALESLMLAKLAVAFAAIGYLVNRAMTGGPLTVRTAPVKWALVLAVLGVLSIPAGYWPGGSVNAYTDLFAKSIVIFVLIANVVDTQERFRIFVGSMIAWGVFTAVNAVVNYATGRLDPTGQRIAGYESPLAVNPNDLALTMNILIGLAIGLLAVVRSRAKRLALIAAIGIMIAGVVVTFSRSGFVTLGVVGAIWAARRLRERGGRALPSIAIVALVVALAVPAGYSDRLSTIVHTDQDTTGSADERWETMALAVRLIAERPVLGYGLGNNVHVSFDRTGLSREAHNAYLKLGAELGVAALVVYVLFLFSSIAAARAVRKFFRAREEGWELGRLAGGVELALIAFAVGAFFAPVPYHFYAYYPAGLAVAIFAIAARVPAPVRRRAD